MSLKSSLLSHRFSIRPSALLGLNFRVRKIEFDSNYPRILEARNLVFRNLGLQHGSECQMRERTTPVAQGANPKK